MGIKALRTVVSRTAVCGTNASARLARALALLAVLSFEVASGEGERSQAALVATLSAEIVVVWLTAWLFRPLTKAASATIPALVILSSAIVAFALEIAVRGIRDEMLGFELLILSLLRNGVLMLAAFTRNAERHRTSLERTTCGLSMFLMIFSASVSARPLLPALVVLFAILGMWWLMGSHWDSLRNRIAASSADERPRRWSIVLPLVVLLALSFVPLAGHGTYALPGFMPSSGGNCWYDETARSGVGDGDALVAGTEKITSFAPIENAPFLNGHEPTLYDLLDDTYDEPVRPSRADRAIALAPQLAARQRAHDIARSETAGKEFSTLRKSGQERTVGVADRNSPALLYVKGRVPLHLKLEAFDRYNGIEWFPELKTDDRPALILQTLHGRSWLSTSGLPDFDLYGLPELHVLKFIHFDSNRVPSPTQFLRLHLDQLDRADLFRWALPGILQIDRHRIPALSVFHLQSRVVDERLARTFVTGTQSVPANYLQFGSDPESRRVHELAAKWTAGLAAGWPQIQAIVTKLREEYQHDRAARPPAESLHTVSDFLFRNQRGPDYLFASAAVWLLRSQGYGARLVSGFYVDPSRFEARSRHTPVLKEDLHFWVEVSAGLGHWIPVEPTPGYELLAPPPTFSDRVQRTLASLASFADLHRWKIVFTCIAAILLGMKRRQIADWGATLLWTIFSGSSNRQFSRRTLSLLESRFHRAGLSRPSGLSPSRWLRLHATLGGAAERESLLAFSDLADWACFAPCDCPAPCDDPRSLCHEAVTAWSWRAIRQVSIPRSNRRVLESWPIDLKRIAELFFHRFHRQKALCPHHDLH